MLWYHIYTTPTCGIFRAVEPLAEVDPADRKNARADTPAPEAAAWLADPDKPREEVLTPSMRYIQWLTDQPEWTGPLLGEDPTPEDIATLDTAHQLALLLTYRDRQGHAATAAALGCSVRTVAYILPAARRRLADVLDRCDLL